MNKSLITISVLLVIFSMAAVPIFAMNAGGPSAVNGLARGTNTHLYLYEKDSETWEIVEDCMWGKLNINVKQGTFIFNGHGLIPRDSYELICYLDPWPGMGSISLGSAVADEEGNVHIKGTIDLESLPRNEGIGGSKIWLVLDADFDGSKMVAWNPTKYLFEYDLLNKVE